MAKKQVAGYEINPKDVVGSRLLVLLVISLIYIFYLISVYTSIINIQDILLGFSCIKITFYVSIVLLVLALVFFIMRRAQKKDEKLKVVNSKNILYTAVVFFLASTLIYKMDVEGIKIMYCVIPACFILYLIYNVYLREFFVISLSCVLGAAALFFLDKINLTVAGISTNLFSRLKSAYLPLVIVVILLSVLLCVAVILAQKNHGKLKFGKRELKIASGGANYALLYIGALLPLAGAVVSLFYAPIVIYMIYILAVYFVCMFVYYTYKLMNK